ncbi:MAG: hypothetical protein IT443_08370 [Phycisphaeraceae bacterium]|nr:hypothetical protein [Phycisphaeraceae bacterium]
MIFRHVLAVLFFVLTTSSVSAAASGYIEPQEGEIFRPVISGDWIAWGETQTFGLYLNNIVTGETRTVVAPAQHGSLYYGTTVLWEFAPWHPNIALGGSKLVWADRRTVSGQPSIHLRTYDLVTGVEKALLPSYTYRGSENYFPATDGQTVVWQYNNNGVGRADMDTGNNRWYRSVSWPTPAVSGPWVVWKNGEEGGALLARNQTSGLTTQFFTATDKQTIRPPVIDGTLVAWSMRDMTEGDNIVKIMAYDLATGTLTMVKDHTGSPEHRSNVAVSGNLVLWEDWRNNTDTIDRYNLDVWGYDLATGVEFPVATGPGNQHVPWLSGHTAVWVDDALGHNRIGWKTISTPEPASLLSLVLGCLYFFKRPRSQCKGCV